MRLATTLSAVFCLLAAFAAGPTSATAATDLAPENAAAAKPAAPQTVKKSKPVAAKAAPVTKPVRTAAVSKSPTSSRVMRPGDGFMYQKRFVRVEAFRSFASNEAPAVIILHGASGLGDGTLFYPQARALQERGISAFIVHYFDGLGARNPASVNLHDERERIVNRALDYVEALPFVDRARIGVFGVSLGGFQAVSIASRDSRVQAVVNVIGAMPAQVAREGVYRMPPTLIMHGDRDRTVPFRRAQELAAMLDNLGTPYEMKVYHGENHYFRPAAREDSVREAVDFFERYLNQPG